MVKTLPASQQTLIYLTGGLTMLTASLSVLNSLPIYVLLFSITVGIISILQIELQFAKTKTRQNPSAWGLNLLRISRKIAPEAYTSVEITPTGYNPRPHVRDSMTKITAYIISRVAKHVKTQKTEVKIDELEETSLLYIQVKGRANSELDASQLIQLTDSEVEPHIKLLGGSTMYESENGITTVLIEFPNQPS